MKKSTILWFVWLIAFCALAIRLGVSFGDLPGQFRPNWFAIVPAVAAFGAFLGLVVRKELAANRAQSAHAGRSAQPDQANSTAQTALAPAFNEDAGFHANR